MYLTMDATAGQAQVDMHPIVFVGFIVLTFLQFWLYRAVVFYVQRSNRLKMQTLNRLSHALFGLTYTLTSKVRNYICCFCYLA